MQNSMAQPVFNIREAYVSLYMHKLFLLEAEDEMTPMCVLELEFINCQIVDLPLKLSSKATSNIKALELSKQKEKLLFVPVQNSNKTVDLQTQCL
jgi:hypothetical protein